MDLRWKPDDVAKPRPFHTTREEEDATFDVDTLTQRKMANLDMLLLKGASSENPEASLNELRYAILAKGIPANSEGMVSSSLGIHLRAPAWRTAWRVGTLHGCIRY